MILSGDILSSKGQILLVDDEEMVLEVGTQMLEKIGYAVFKAKTLKALSQKIEELISV